MTKPVTAACVLALADGGALDLDASVEALLAELAGRRVLVRPDGPREATVPATRAITARDLLTFTWGLGMPGAMYVAPEPWPIVTAAKAIHAFGPPAPAKIPDADTWMARLGELPLVAQPGERWLYSTGSQVPASSPGAPRVGPSPRCSATEC